MEISKSAASLIQIEIEKTAAKKRIFIFAVLALLFAWALFFAIPLSGMIYGNGLSIILVMAAMFAPALASVLTRLITKEGFGNMYLLPHIKGHVLTYILVFFGPTLLMFLSGAVYFLIFPSQFDPSLTTFRLLAAQNGKDISPSTMMLISVLEVIFLGPIINIIPTLGEELGWRGYLLPKLRMLFSDRAALVITGAFWGLWHAPIIAQGHNYGLRYAGYPYLGILMMIVFCVFLGIIEGYVSIKLKSCIPAAMIHSAVNAGAGLPLYLIQGKYNPILGPTIAGILGAIPFIILAAVLLIKAKGRFDMNELLPASGE